MKRLRQPRTSIRAAALPALILAAGIGLAFYQLTPGSELTLKLKISLAGVVVISALALTFLIRGLIERLRLSRVQWSFAIGASVALTIFLVFWFGLSLPHKKITLPEKTITLSIDASGIPQRSKRRYVFLSLHDGFQGVPLSAFSASGAWRRENDRLTLEISATESAALRFTGKVGHEIAIFAEQRPDSGILTVDWGDGLAQDIDLSDAPGGAEPIRVAHRYGSETLFFERVDFGLNLLSAIVLISAFFALYFALTFSFVARRSPSFRAVFLLITAAAVAMRIFNIFNLPLDWDEGTYSRAAMRYADKVLTLKLADIPAIEYNHEHPALVKLAFSVPIVLDGRESFERIGLPLNEKAQLQREDHAIFTSRFVSAFFNVLTAQALSSLIHPVAAFFFMIHSMMSEMGSTARLEAIPAFFSFLSIIFAWRALREQICARPSEDAVFDRKSWLLSSACLGATAASKVIYCVVAFAIGTALLTAFFRAPRRRAELLWTSILYALIALAAFFALNPSLWYDPLGRIAGMFNFHRNYQTDHNSLHPAYQPLIWIFRSVPLAKPGGGILSPVQRNPFGLIFAADELILMLAIAGLPRLWKRSSIFIGWLAAGVAFMFVWGTKWQHYTCIITVPICVAAMYGVFAFQEKLGRYNAVPGNNRGGQTPDDF